MKACLPLNIFSLYSMETAFATYMYTVSEKRLQPHEVLGGILVCRNYKVDIILK